jgi:hypothetical protein
MTRRKKPATKSRTKRTPKKKTAPDWTPSFLCALRESANIKSSCAAAGICRTTFYDRRDRDTEFAALVVAALDDAVDELELEARRRALKGCERPVFHQGEECGRILEYSDTLMIFLLKAHRPEKYRERHDVRHSGQIATGAAEGMTDDELARIATADVR